MKVISYSLYLPSGRVNSKNLRYLCGLCKSIKSAQLYFPDWFIYIVIDKTVPIEWIELLQSQAQVRIVRLEEDYHDREMSLQRFAIADNAEIEVMICRDADNNLTELDAKLVDQWIHSEEPVMLYYYPDNQWTFLAGGFGVKPPQLRIEWHQSIVNFSGKYDSSLFGSDQTFLDNLLRSYPKYQIDIIYDGKKDKHLDALLVLPVNNHLPKVSNAYTYCSKILNHKSSKTKKRKRVEN